VVSNYGDYQARVQVRFHDDLGIDMVALRYAAVLRELMADA
jgi:hypothetical protein